jgi:hypothetical protein
MAHPAPASSRLETADSPLNRRTSPKVRSVAPCLLAPTRPRPVPNLSPVPGSVPRCLRPRCSRLRTPRSCPSIYPKNGCASMIQMNHDSNGSFQDSPGGPRGRGFGEGERGVAPGGNETRLSTTIAARNFRTRGRQVPDHPMRSVKGPSGRSSFQRQNASPTESGCRKRRSPLRS